MSSLTWSPVVSRCLVIFLGATWELGETPTEALERELLEELGVSVYSLPPGPLMRLSTVDVEMGIWFVESCS